MKWPFFRPRYAFRYERKVGGIAVVIEANSVEDLVDATRMIDGMWKQIAHLVDEPAETA